MGQQVGEYGMSILDLVKIPINHFISKRRQHFKAQINVHDNPRALYQFLLLTTHPNKDIAIKSDWNDSIEDFLKKLSQLKVESLSHIGNGFATAFRMLKSKYYEKTEDNININHHYGQGWQSWNSETNVIIYFSCNPYSIDLNLNIPFVESFNIGLSRLDSDILSSDLKCNDQTDFENYHKIINLIRKQRRDVLFFPKFGLMKGDKLDLDWYSWNTRIFICNILPHGTLNFKFNYYNSKLNMNQLNNYYTMTRACLNDLTTQTNPTCLVLSQQEKQTQTKHKQK